MTDESSLEMGGAKKDVQQHGSDGNCGTRGVDPEDRPAFFDMIEEE